MDYNIIDDYEDVFVPDTDEIVTQADKDKQCFKILHNIFDHTNIILSDMIKKHT